jgi:hypothetical protein
MTSKLMNADKRNQQPVQFQNQERKAMPVDSDEKRPLPIAGGRKG